MENVNNSVAKTEATNKKMTKREKVFLGLAVLATAAAGYAGYKYISLEKVHKLLTQSRDELKDSVETLMAAASEGVFEEAIGTVNNKITYRIDKKKYLEEYLRKNPTHIDARNVLLRVQAELSDLTRRKEKIEAAQKLYEIKNEI